jgi:hypothetical protein
MSILKARELTPELSKKAAEDLEESPQKLIDSYLSLKKWIDDSKYLKSRTDAQFLLAFLRSSKFNIAIAKEKLEAFYTVRSPDAGFIKCRDPLDERIRSIFKLG